jgi:hypothetical protein
MSLQRVVLWNIRFSATSNVVCVCDLTTNKWLQMVHKQVKQVYDINEALAKGINPLDIEFVIWFVEYALAHNADPGQYSDFCTPLHLPSANHSPYQGPFNIPTRPVPQYNHLVIPAEVLPYLPYQHNECGQLVYGLGRIVDRFNILASQQHYNLTV